MRTSRNTPHPEQPQLNLGLFAPGDRVCAAVSGGADSTALLRLLAHHQQQLGIVLSVLHVEHGLRGADSVADAEFVQALAQQLHLPCEVISVDTPARMAAEKESLEEAARNLRYQVFRVSLATGKVDKIATAHTLDDQAETVLMKLLRGAWTEGLSGIHPLLKFPDLPGCCVRPLLHVSHSEIEAYLRFLHQPWRQDASNDSTLYTRNRLRHELLPQLQQYNPRVKQALAHVAANAQAEEQHWQAELDRILPHLLLPGKPVRGGGRSVATSGIPQIAIDLARLRALDSGLQRRVLRTAAERSGATLDFDATERLLEMVAAGSGSTGKQLELPGGVIAMRSARELQFTPGLPSRQADPANLPHYQLPVPGSVEAPAFGALFRASLVPPTGDTTAVESLPAALVRAWQPGDTVQLAYSGGPKKVKEVLERMGIRGQARALWPVVVWEGSILWMRGVRLESHVLSRSAPGSTSGDRQPRQPVISEVLL